MNGSDSPPRAARALVLTAVTILLTALTIPMLPAHADEPADDEPQLVVDKTNDADRDGDFSDVEDVGGAGNPVTFRVELTNTADRPMTVTAMTDTMLTSTLDLIGEGHCPTFDGLTLAPDEVATCTFTLDRYLRTYDPPPREGLTNVVEVVATDGEAEVTASDDSTVNNPNAHKVSVAVDKTNDADGDGTFTDSELAAAPGTDVTFEVVVRNTSPGTVRVAGLTDTWPGLDEPIDLFSLCPTLDGMKLWGVGGGHDTGGHADGGHDDGHDDGHDSGHDDGHDGGHERPTSATCTFTLGEYTPAAGASLTDTVTATVVKGHSPQRSATATDTSTVTTAPEQVQANPSIALEKRVGVAPDGPFGDHDQAPGLQVSIPEGGAAVYYQLEVTNTGDTVLTDILLQDTQVDVDSCTIPPELAPLGTFDCLLGPVIALTGPQVNEATVTAMGAATTVDATDAAHYRGTAVAPAAVERPAISLTKVADLTPDDDGIKSVRYDPSDADEETVTYLFTVENTGETPLTGVALTDDRLGAIELGSTTLEVGETVRLEVTHVIDEDDAATGTIRNRATVQGTAPDDTIVTAEATEVVTVLEVRGEAVAALPAVLPITGASLPGLRLLGVAALAGAVSLLTTGRGRRRR